MSTRRARIKAVTSLPPRRKNAVVAENKVKDTEKSTKSPRTPLNENKSPRAKNVTESKTLENIGHNMIEKLVTSEKPPSLSETTIGETLSNASTPRVLHTPEKIRFKDNKKSSSNVFASPARRDSPRKTFASPIAPSPKISKTSDLQRPHTPQRATPTAHKISENNELQIAERIVSKIDHNVKPKMQMNAKDDYNIPSVPESTDDEGMDGIVPLKPAASVPKPIDVLKNEIISENAEVLFDPIIPLPSPSKVRPKLRPVPRLAPLRRNSVQGSASESEDENRRSLLNLKDRQAHDVHTLQSLPNRDVSRVRNDSVCSSVSQAPTQLAAAASPARDKQQIQKARRQEETRRRMAMRRRRENAKRDTLTMYDLIFYNPTSNPLVLNEDEIKLKEAKEKQEAERIAKEKEVAVKPPDSPKKSTEPVPVPQIKLGPKGEIILDEQSLVIKQTESDRKVSSVVHEGAWGTGGQYKKLNFCRSAGWTAPETVRFYRALAALGTDFTLMAQLFPDRTRKQLKLKFKKEERLNGAQIDRALRASLQFDIALLKAEFEEERATAARQAELEREKLNKEKQAERERLKTSREVRMRQSRGAKALEAYKDASVDKNMINADDIIHNHILQKQKNHKDKQQTKPVTPSPKRISTMALVTSASKPKEDIANNRTNTPSLQVKTPESINALQIPTNIESGSLVVLTVNDPSSPTKKMLQTYIANGPGKLTPVALPSSILNYVVGYMKKGTPKGSNVSSPLLSPCSVTSVESHNSAPSGVTMLPSPAKRQRHSSYTITQL
ncbi:transcription factor TFIIIB component B'' [Maniola jurtina]|uniref:transcription factor TFIIIB component B'' n=1 Tax=Maniola jurtina TaxID=191418 RepID=UPI001E68694E|nr:transcription factor TFIIIB component B'' [Maniola jurtina]XP_045777447.1 transcription factor TFIIIB component B'' [Maniola jurtina]